MRALAGLLLLALAAFAEAPAVPPIREQAVVRDAWLKERLETVVPALMRREGVDMWLLVAREGMDDPVLRTMLPAEQFGARRRTILMFFDPGDGKPLERLTVSRYGLGDFFTAVWRPEEEPDQWKRLAELVAERNPRRIAINSSAGEAYADGLTSTQHAELMTSLGETFRARTVSGENLSVGWLETRIGGEIEAYRAAVAMTRAIVHEAFSRAVIAPGKTTTADVEWWFRQRIADKGLATWFQPSVGVMRPGAATYLEGATVIQPGDLIWCDVGVVYLGMHTDMQQLGYVLKAGETGAPAGLAAGLRANNRVQDHLTDAFRDRDSGNAILARARAASIADGLHPTIYSHPIGYHGHAAGPSIGFWDRQEPDPQGDAPVNARTAWSIELTATHAVPEWGGQKVPFRTEEDAWFDGRRVEYLAGRQTELILIPSD